MNARMHSVHNIRQYVVRSMLHTCTIAHACVHACMHNIHVQTQTSSPAKPNTVLFAAVVFQQLNNVKLVVIVLKVGLWVATRTHMASLHRAHLLPLNVTKHIVNSQPYYRYHDKQIVYTVGYFQNKLLPSIDCWTAIIFTASLSCKHVLSTVTAFPCSNKPLEFHDAFFTI